MKKRTLIIVIALIALVLIGGLFIFKKEAKKESLENTNQEQFDSSNWKEYVSSGWGYSIKYPSDLYIKSDTQGDKFPGDTEGDENVPKGWGTWDGGQTLIISDKERMGIQDIMPNERIHITINTFKIDSNRDKGQTWEQYFNSTNNGLLKIKMDKFDIYEGVNDYSNEERQFYRYIVKGDWVFNLGGAVYFKNKQISSDDFELIKKIILTFEFIK
jgi:hypothetical protein